MRDELAMKRATSVRSRRNDNTSIRFLRTPKRTPSELRLFGRLPDAEMPPIWALFGVGAKTNGCSWHRAGYGQRLRPIARNYLSLKRSHSFLKAISLSRKEIAELAK